MSKTIDRRLALKKETLRQLSDGQLGAVRGGFASSEWCQNGNASGKCGSTTIDFDPRQTEGGGGRSG